MKESAFDRFDIGERKKSVPQPASRNIRIIATPPGQAPLWVRDKWVGLQLPLAARYPQRRLRSVSSGVLDGPPTFLGFLGRLFRGRLSMTEGFAVDSAQAIAILESKHPDAATWWNSNTPRLIKTNRCFVFQNDVCEVI